MKIKSISGSNFNIAAKNQIAAKNSAVSSFKAYDNFANTKLQNAGDTVSFTGHLPFQKVSPVIQKGISELPISKALQKQLVKLAGQADTFFAKAQIYMEQFAGEPDLSAGEKSIVKHTSSLVKSARELFSGKKFDEESLLNMLYKEKDLFASLDKLDDEAGILKTDAKMAVDKKFLDLIDEAIQKLESGDECSADYGTDLIKRIVGVLKEEMAIDPEGIKEFAKEISAVKLPFWKK